MESDPKIWNGYDIGDHPEVKRRFELPPPIHVNAFYN